MRAVIYARFSSDRQTEMSIDAQVRACQEYANKMSINIIRTYADEAISGTTNKRPKYQEMLSDAFEDKFDLILIHKYDRIARNLEEQVTLESRLKSLNIRLVAVAQDYGVGKDANLTKGIQWVLGEYYSANLSEETKKGHKEIALKALHNGGYPPFGYDVKDQRYVINEIEAEFVKRMFATCILGGTYKELIGCMNAAGIVGKRGKPIKYSQIYEILHNEKYTGTYIYCLNEEPNRAERRIKQNAIRIEDAFPAIISKEDFNKVQVILASRKKGRVVKHPCSGLVYCECGAKMHLSNTTRKGHEYHNFRCSNKCGAPGVAVSLVEEAVNTYLNELFSDENKVEIEKALNNLRKYNKEKSKSFEETKKDRIKKLESEISNIMKAISSGEFNENYALANSLITEKRKEIDVVRGMRNTIIDDRTVKKWLSEIVSENYSPGIFIDRIIIRKDSIEIISNFKEVLGNFNYAGLELNEKNTTESDETVVSNLGCGGTIGIYPTTLPHILFSRVMSRDTRV